MYMTLIIAVSCLCCFFFLLVETFFLYSGCICDAKVHIELQACSKMGRQKATLTMVSGTKSMPDASSLSFSVSRPAAGRSALQRPCVRALAS